LPGLRDLPSTMVWFCKRSFPLLASPANAPEENTRADPIRRIETFDNFMNSSFNVSAATLCRTPHAPRAERILFALSISESTRRGKSFRGRTARKVYRTSPASGARRWPASLHLQSWSEHILRDEAGDIIFDCATRRDAPVGSFCVWCEPLPPHSVEIAVKPSCASLASS